MMWPLSAWGCIRLAAVADAIQLAVADAGIKRKDIQAATGCS
jgi:hypothetical protein